jgi:hypothetical protein
MYVLRKAWPWTGRFSLNLLTKFVCTCIPNSFSDRKESRKLDRFFFAPCSTSWLSLNKSSRNSQLLDGIAWRFAHVRFSLNVSIKWKVRVKKQFAVVRGAWLLPLHFSRKSYLPDQVSSRTPLPNVMKIGQNRLMTDTRSQTEGLYTLQNDSNRLTASQSKSFPDRISWRMNKRRKY